MENLSAYLVSLVTRLAIDTLGAARNRLTDYVGPWLPEPLVGRAAPPEDDPASRQERGADPRDLYRAQSGQAGAGGGVWGLS